MKKLALISLLACLMTGCHINLNGETKWTYEHPERYTVGDATLTQTINDIDISWLEGNIDIVYADHPDVRIYEVTDSALSDSLRMHWYVDDDGCLDIRFCKSGSYKTNHLNNLGKRLTVEVPRGTVLNAIDMDIVSASVKIDSVVCNELSVDGISFDILASYQERLPNEIDIDGVNCEININMASNAGMTIDMDGVKSNLNCSIPSTKSGKKTVIGDGACKVDFDGVNCTLNINK